MFCNTVSVLNRSWVLRPDPISQDDHPAVIGDGVTLAAETALIAKRRGAVDLQAFLLPSLKEAMPDPSSLVNMDQAVDRFARAVRKRERIAVLGDYDVDGATSTSLLLLYQRFLRLDEGIFHIPHRLKEGYGPSVPAIENLFAQGATLLVIADSGTSAFIPIDRARELGMDVIVLDHHEPNENGDIPNAIVVNPKLPPNDGSLSYLCTAGLAFLFLVAVNRRLRLDGYFQCNDLPEPPLKVLLGLVALGTVADVVPLVGLNRAYVSAGLGQMALIPGIEALKKVVTAHRRQQAMELGKPFEDIDYTTYACGFVFGPCINAAGRISDTRMGTELLTCHDPVAAEALAQDLFEINKERQAIQEVMVSQCIASVEDAGPEDGVLVLYDPDWHPGVIGLGASKVKDRFDRNAVVIGAGGKGSGRSVEGFNIGVAFLRAVAAGLLVKGGGHGAAGGLTIDPARLDDFRIFMNEQARGFQRPSTKVDLVVPVGGLSVEAVWNFDLLEPFGRGNAKPKVVFTGGILSDIRILKDKHIKARLVADRNRVDIILFNGVNTPLGDALIRDEGRYVDVVGEASVNLYNGRSSIQVKPSDVMVGAAATLLAEMAA